MFEYYDGLLHMTDVDISNAYMVKDLLPEKACPIVFHSLTTDARGTFLKSISSFDRYNDTGVISRIDIEKNNIVYYIIDALPYYYSTSFIRKNDMVEQRIICPSVMDDTSYVFLGHEFHHILKDSNVEEKKLRHVLAEVIPLFYELLSSSFESNILKKDILSKRINLLILDSTNFNSSMDEGLLQYFNSYYYALCLYERYLDNQDLVLKMVSRVLNNELNTLDMLLILDLYDNGMDKLVYNAMSNIKEFIKNS